MKTAQTDPGGPPGAPMIIDLDATRPTSPLRVVTQARYIMGMASADISTTPIGFRYVDFRAIPTVEFPRPSALPSGLEVPSLSRRVFDVGLYLIGQKVPDGVTMIPKNPVAAHPPEVLRRQQILQRRALG